MEILPNEAPKLRAIFSARYCDPVPKKSLVKIPFRQKLCGEDTYTNDTNYFELHEFVGTIRMFDHPQKFLSRNRFLIRNLSFINPIRVIRANWCNSCASAAGRG